MRAARARIITAAVAALVATLLPAGIGAAPASAADCPQYTVIAARGSGQSFGASRELSQTLYFLRTRAAATGVRIDTTGAELTASEYMAVGVATDKDNFWKAWSDRGPAAMIVGVTAFFHSGPYEISVAAGVTSVKTRLLALRLRCGTMTKAILVGYSQGAQVLREAADTASPSERALIAGAILYGDPYFDPADPSATSSFDPGRHGLLGHDTFDGPAPAVSVCHARDPICQGFGTRIFGRTLGFDQAEHENYGGAKGTKTVDDPGEAPGAVNALSRKLGWGRPPVGPGTGGPLDLVFAIDTTGSMDDDIDAVRQSLNQTVDRLSSVSTSWRVAVVAYKDSPDEDSEYRSRVEQGFTNDVSLLRSAIDRLEASGGGDDPESVYSGMMTGLSLTWRSSARRSLMVMGDAPAHDPEPGTGYRLADVAAKARSVSVTTTMGARMAAPDPAATSASTFPVVVGDDPAAIESMTDIASVTRGQVFTSPEESDVPDAVGAAVSAAGIGLTADAGGPYLSATGSELTLSAAASSSVVSDITSYAWDFGDGQTSSAGASPLVTHTYADEGTYSAKVTITDRDGNSSVATAQVEVVSPPSAPPAAPTGVAAQARPDGSVAVTWSSDPEYYEGAGFAVEVDGTAVDVSDDDGTGSGATRIAGLPLGQPVSITVRQLTLTSNGPASTAASVTPKADTSLSVPKVTLTAGQAGRVTGTISASGNPGVVPATVAVSTRAPGSAAWVSAQHVTVDQRNGRFSAPLRAMPAGTRLRVASADSAAFGASSAEQVVSVRRAVTVRGVPATVRRGQPARITGTVRPAGVVTVSLQRQSGRTWSAVATTRTSTAGTYGFTVRSRRPGTTTYRVVVGAAQGYLGTTSTSARLVVRR